MKAPKRKNQHKKGRSWIWTLSIGIALGVSLKAFLFDSVDAVTTHCGIERQNVRTIVYENQFHPISQHILRRQGYTLAYDGRTKTAAWVFEELTRDSIGGTVERAQFHFCPDPDLPTIVQADLNDYRGSGFDRGHLAPAGNHRSSNTAMQETFYLSNISPQRAQFNRGCWKRFEKHVRDLTKDYDRVRVVTGPLFLAHNEIDGKRYVKYQVIGENDVAVPTHFFKVISAEKGALERKWAYIFPHDTLDPNINFADFETSLEQIQKTSGIVFEGKLRH